MDNAYWNKALGTITANATTAPDGTLTADLFTKTSGVNTVSQLGSSTSVYTTTGANTLSVYIKPNVGNSVILRLDNGGNTANFAFNFTTKTFSSSGANVISSSFDELLNGWFRLKVTGNVTSTSWSLTHCLLFDNPTNDSMYIWGAQLEQGSTATEYIPTTNSARTTFAGITQDGTSASNVPRLDYSQGSCPALLLEGQRTNLALRSEEFDNASWTAVDSTVTANAEISPSGATNAETMTITGSTSRVSQNISLGAGTFQVSVYVKVISQTTAGTMRLLGVVDGSNSSVNFTPTSQWQRVEATYTAAVGISSLVIRGNASAFAGTIAIWGFQVEQGAYATSYIKTTSATVTRLADVCSKTGISSLIGQTEGTLYWEGRTISGVGTDLLIIGTTQDSIFLNLTTTTILKVGVRANFTLLLSAQSTTLSGTYFKIAVAYKSGDIVAYVNGAQVITNSTSFTFSDLISSIEIGRPFYDAKATQFNQASALFTTRLSNTQLSELTTL
jgi:hypothetical protein